MEPKAIKQERETPKDDSSEEAACSPEFRNPGLSPNHDQRNKAKGHGRSEIAASNVTSTSSTNAINCSNSEGPRHTAALTYNSPTPKSHGHNESHSPHSTLNGNPTPSPPALTSNLLFHGHPQTSLDAPVNAAMVATAPTATAPPGHHNSTTPGASSHNGVPCNGREGSQRQLTKVRRFLTTLQQFASDIGQDVGDRVRSLTLNLLSGSISVEDFHGALQEVTHFPLRPFVLPFLRSHLPLLTRELHAMARRASMPISQYVAMQEQNLLESTAGEPLDFFSTEVTSGKRKHEGYIENGDTGFVPGSLPTNTTTVNGIPGGTNLGSHGVGGGGAGGNISPPPSKRSMLFSPPYPSLGVSPELSCGSTGREFKPIPAQDDEWKNIHVMLTCILSMVEKTRRALTMLQQREERDYGGILRGSTSLEGRTKTDYDNEVKRQAADLVAQAIRSTEDRVAEVKRKAEEAVNDVRRAAVVEVQRAVAAAESKAQELMAVDRSRIDSLLREVSRRDASGEQKIDSAQACWNCGRKAQDTCSGCSVAKYCGPFCQHKDWDHHHKVCSPSLAATTNAPSLLNNKNNFKLLKNTEITKNE